MAPAPDRHKDPLFHSRMIRPVRGQGHGWRAYGSFPKGARRLSEKSPARHPHRISLRLAARLLRLPLKGGVIALGARASRPHPVPLAAAELQCDAAGSHPVGGNRSGQAEGEPWRRFRLIQVGEMAELCQALCGRDARAPGKPSSHDIVTPRARNCRSILVPLVVEGGPSVFVPICVHSCPFVVRLHERSAVFPRMIRTPGRGLRLPEATRSPASFLCPGRGCTKCWNWCGASARLDPPKGLSAGLTGQANPATGGHIAC